MNLGTLKYAPGSRKKRKRIGRGQGSGYGKVDIHHFKDGCPNEDSLIALEKNTRLLI